MQNSPTRFHLSWIVLLFTGYASISAADAPKYGPNAVPFSARAQSTYLKAGAGPDYHALLPFYVGQDTSSACSLAAFATLLNAIQAMDLKGKVNASTKNFTLDRIRKELADPEYVVKMSGDPKLALRKKTLLGVGIAEYRTFVEKMLTKADVTVKKPEVNLVEFKKEDGGHRKGEGERFLTDLKANEKSDRDFIILNFTQGVLTGDPEGMIGHVGVVAAYDEKSDSVLILDTDRDYYQPYWAPRTKVFEAIVDKNADRVAPGYLYITVK